MTSLATEYLGLHLTSPLVASAGPLTGHLDTLLRLEDSGIAAVVLPSLFEEELERQTIFLHETLEQGVDQNPETTGYFPEMDFTELGLDRHLRLVERAKQILSVPVIASVNAIHPGAWSHYATLMEQAGANAIELNLYSVPSNPSISPLALEQDLLDTIAEVRRAITVPLAVKLSPFFSSAGHFALQAVSAGADGLVLFNRFYQPDLDLDSLSVSPQLELSHSFELRLPLRWIALLRSHLPNSSLAASTGIHTGADAAKALLVGADVVMMTSALLRNGPEHVSKVEQDLLAWMELNEYVSVAQLRGSVSYASTSDPTSFERSQYIQVLSQLHYP